MKKSLTLLVLIMLTNISCSSDKDVDPILITINNTVWTTDETVGKDYFQEIKDGKREGLYIFFLNGEIDLKYYLRDSASYKNVIGLYEYKSALLRIETNDGRIVQYRVLGNRMELITPNVLLGVEEKENFPSYLYLF